MQDIGGSKGAPGTPPGSKFFHFHAVFGKNQVSTPTLGVGAPLRKSWICHWGARDMSPFPFLSFYAVFGKNLAK